MNDEKFDFTIEQITQTIDTWDDYRGFVGRICWRCNSSLNVINGRAFICPKCRQHSPDTGVRVDLPLHDKPDYGPGIDAIRKGWEASEKFKIWMAKLVQDSQTVLSRVTAITECRPGEWGNIPCERCKVGAVHYSINLDRSIFAVCTTGGCIDTLWTSITHPVREGGRPPYAP
jgi:hypothetical protein